MRELWMMRVENQQRQMMCQEEDSQRQIDWDEVDGVKQEAAVPKTR